MPRNHDWILLLRLHAAQPDDPVLLRGKNCCCSAPVISVAGGFIFLHKHPLKQNINFRPKVKRLEGSSSNLSLEWWMSWLDNQLLQLCWFTDVCYHANIALLLNVLACSTANMLMLHKLILFLVLGQFQHSLFDWLFLFFCTACWENRLRQTKELYLFSISCSVNVTLLQLQSSTYAETPSQSESRVWPSSENQSRDTFSPWVCSGINAASSSLSLLSSRSVRHISRVESGQLDFFSLVG